MNPFQIRRKVFYDDTDAGGVVYHANYIKYFEHARSEFLAQFGFELEALVQNEGVLFAVVNIEVDFKSPARLSDQLIITAFLRTVRGTSMIFEQSVLRQNELNQESLLLAQAKVRVVCLSASNFKPCPIPDNIREKVKVNVN